MTISKIEDSMARTGLALSPKQLKIVLEVLHENLPDYQAWAFGSRATGRARKYSDLDIAVSHPQALPFHKLCQLSSAFEASDLDIVDWPRANPEFRQHVERKGMVRIRSACKVLEAVTNMSPFLVLL